MAFTVPPAPEYAAKPVTSAQSSARSAAGTGSHAGSHTGRPRKLHASIDQSAPCT